MTESLPAKQRHARRARARRRREGVALLVIMIIIVITTFAASISVQNTTSEMQAAARERMTVHARYAAEAALVATISYIERPGDFTADWERYRQMPLPLVSQYTGGHPISADPRGRHDAARITGEVLMLSSVGGVPPVSSPDPGAAIPDLTGSFGPNQSYSMPAYDVDLTDCYAGPLIPGSQVDGSAGSVHMYCVLTVRGRLLINGDAGAGLQWDLPDGTNTGFQDRTGAAHDARAIIQTPPVRQ
jgi:hypothetical protein